MSPWKSEDGQTIDRQHQQHSADQQIVERVQDVLNSSGYPQLRQLRIHFDHGRVTLQGRLATYYLKQLAQTLVLSVEGVRDLDNDVKVHGSK